MAAEIQNQKNIYIERKGGGDFPEKQNIKAKRELERKGN